MPTETLKTAELWLVAFLGAHLGLCRALGTRNFIRNSVLLLVGFWATLLLRVFLLPFTELWESLAVLWIAGTGANLYLVFLINIKNSVTLQYLEGIALSEKEEIAPVQDPERVIPISEQMNARWAALLASQLVEKRGEGYALTWRGKTIAWSLDVFSKALGTGAPVHSRNRSGRD